MKKLNQFIMLVLVLVTSAIFLSGCSDQEEEKKYKKVAGIEVTRNAVKGTPQINGKVATSKYLSRGMDQGSPARFNYSSNSSLIESYFKLECQMDDVNFCPEGVAADENSKFTLLTLVGNIYHAEMYINNIYPEPGAEVEVDDAGNPILPHESCGKLNGKVLSGDASVVPVDGSKFIVDMSALYDCAGSEPEFDGTRYVLYSKAEDEKTYAVLWSSKNVHNTNFETHHSQITQAYVHKGDSTVLAFNLVGRWKGVNYTGTSSGNRSVGIVNSTTNKFIVKYIWPAEDASDKNKKLVALGTGGYDPETGVWADGYYMIKAYSEGWTTDSAGEDLVCIRNGITPTVVDSSNCAEISGFFSTTGWTLGEVHQWLGTTSEDQTNLAGFNGFFDDSSFLTNDEAPLNTTDSFPDSITAE
ncbi:MAG: hypothetical protein HQM12_12040 [SAR324 cluster bacterium]|nr:hypothetical protein [SAR324 cluster bacterium]